MNTTPVLLAQDGAVSGTPRLIIAALIGVAVIVALITWQRWHPFLALSLGAIGVGLGAGLGANDVLTSYEKGFGETMGSVGILIGLGAMFGKLLADSGGADQVVDTLVSRSSPRVLPWTMGLVGAVIGLPMFFEIGIVLLMPVIILVTRRSGLPLMKIAIPTLAGLSAMHGLVPPHPGPLVAISALDANLGLTLALGVVVAIPTVIIAGPLFSTFAAKWVDVPAPDLFGATEGDDDTDRRRPAFVVTLMTILLPVILMMLRAFEEVIWPDSTSAAVAFIGFVGQPIVALGLAVIVGMLTLGVGGGMDRSDLQKTFGNALPPIAGILLIVGAGGGFKQVLIDTGIADVIADAVRDSALPVLFLAWLVAALIRVATGSATVATVTAAGILAPVAADLSTSHVSLMVLAIGSGSLFLSHVNDAGFWMVKEYLGLTVGQNLKTWTVLECLISVAGLAGVLALSLVL
ncbi:gluconate transporter [Rhodococcus rhodnii]|uniref:Gluconate permease family protein n=2 Tax=Rhodococcus rhodnii TaxID=38312 RepID=R7WSM1_9NOCA|nr:gluconate:H+ symporter [Rhodococcus rhodnii]EOM77024.1 gluconate permease family protein [Rhodococcus rhodnii LMG 5362]TXG89902.1 gluconate transporter [Rhodococcus rhodnii]